MIGQVEDVRDELKADRFLDGNLLLHANVIDDAARVGEGIAADHRDEGRARGTVPVAEDGIAGKAAVRYRVRQAVLHLEGVVDAPVVGDVAEEATRVAVWDVDESPGDETVANVVVGVSVVDLRV